MTLIDQEALQVLSALHQRMQTLFTEFLQTRCESTLWVGGTDLTWVTEVNVQETDTDIILWVRLPGVQPEALEIEVTQETVVIRSCQEVAAALSFGHFQTVIPFPRPTHPEAVRATFEQDLLMLTLPKAGSTQRQSVRVAVADRAASGHKPSGQNSPASNEGIATPTIGHASLLRPS